MNRPVVYWQYTCDRCSRKELTAGTVSTDGQPCVDWHHATPPGWCRVGFGDYCETCAAIIQRAMGI